MTTSIVVWTGHIENNFCLCVHVLSISFFSCPKLFEGQRDVFTIWLGWSIRIRCTNIIAWLDWVSCMLVCKRGGGRDEQCWQTFNRGTITVTKDFLSLIDFLQIVAGYQVRGLLKAWGYCLIWLEMAGSDIYDMYMITLCLQFFFSLF